MSNTPKTDVKKSKTVAKTDKKPVSKSTSTVGYEIPTLRNPLKTWWGKVVIVILVLGMVISPFIALIIMLIEKQ